MHINIHIYAYDFIVTNAEITRLGAKGMNLSVLDSFSSLVYVF